MLLCLVRCPRAVHARRCLAMAVAEEIIEMGVANTCCINIWFGNVRVKDGKVCSPKCETTSFAATEMMVLKNFTFEWP